MAVCDKTFHLYTDPNGPYASDMIVIPAYTDIPLETAAVFDFSRDTLRHPRETKGLDYRVTLTDNNSACCSPNTNCC
jgi:hypothetical protein